MTNVIEILRKTLESEGKRLAEELLQLEASGSSSDERREVSSYGKREEEATQTVEKEKRLTMENHLKNQIADIDHALKKFEAGTYGKCESCGQPIAPARLEALPQAKLCMNCKALQGKNAKPRPPVT